MSDNKIEARPNAPESDQVKKVRAKISARLDAQNQFVNEKTLFKVKEVIKAQHHRTISFREPVVEDSKPLSLFAQGVGVKTDAGPRVLALRKRVQKEFDQQHEAYQKYFPPMIIKPLETES